jgi:hypothetical protein
MTSRDLVLIAIGLIIGALVAGVAVNGSLQPAVNAAETQVSAVQTSAAQAASEAAAALAAEATEAASAASQAATAAAGQAAAEAQAATAAAGQAAAESQAATAAAAQAAAESQAATAAAGQAAAESQAATAAAGQAAAEAQAATAAAGQAAAESQAATAAAGQAAAEAQATAAAQQVATLSAQLTQLAPTLEGQRTVNQAAAVSDFYLASLEEAPAWLADGLKLELPESLADLSALAGNIQDPESLLAAAADASNPLRLLLRTAYEGVIAALPADAADLPVAACLALENDFFTGSAVLYFYIQLPKPDVADTKPLAIPQGWQLLDGPLPQSEVWTSACYEAADAEADAAATPSG